MTPPVESEGSEQHPWWDPDNRRRDSADTGLETSPKRSARTVEAPSEAKEKRPAPEQSERRDGWPDPRQAEMGERELRQIAEAVRERQHRAVPAADLAERLPEGAREQYVALLQHLDGTVLAERGQWVFTRLRLLQQIDLPDRSIAVETSYRRRRDPEHQPVSPSKVREIIEAAHDEPVELLREQLGTELAPGDVITLRWGSAEAPHQLVIESLSKGETTTTLTPSVGAAMEVATASGEHAVVEVEPTVDVAIIEEPVTGSAAEPAAGKVSVETSIAALSPASVEDIVDELWKEPETFESADDGSLDQPTDDATEADSPEGIEPAAGLIDDYPAPEPVAAERPGRPEPIAELLQLFEDYGYELNDLPPLGGAQDAEPDQPDPASPEDAEPEPPEEDLPADQEAVIANKAQAEQLRRRRATAQANVDQINEAAETSRQRSRRRRSKHHRPGKLVPATAGTLEIFERHWSEPIRLPDREMRSKARKFLRYLARRYGVKLTPELENYLVEILLRPKLVHGRRVYGLSLNEANLRAVLSVLRFSYGGTPPAAR